MDSLPCTFRRPARQGRDLSVLLPDPTAYTPEAGCEKLAAGEGKGGSGRREGLQRNSDFLGAPGVRGTLGARRSRPSHVGPTQLKGVALSRRQGTIGGRSAASDIPSPDDQASPSYSVRPGSAAHFQSTGGGRPIEDSGYFGGERVCFRLSFLRQRRV